VSRSLPGKPRGGSRSCSAPLIEASSSLHNFADEPRIKGRAGAIPECAPTMGVPRASTRGAAFLALLHNHRPTDRSRSADESSGWCANVAQGVLYHGR
jgi:hypothetical protein